MKLCQQRAGVAQSFGVEDIADLSRPMTDNSGKRTSAKAYLINTDVRAQPTAQSAALWYFTSFHSVNNFECG